MPGYSVDQIPDLLRITKKHFGGDKYTDLAWTRQKLWAKGLWADNAEMLDGGSEIEWTVLTSYLDNTQAKGFYATDTLTSADLNDKAKVRWRKWHTGYDIEQIILAENASSEQRIINYLNQKEVATWTGHWNRVETWFWGHRTRDDGETPYGIRYYIVKDHSDTTVANTALDEGAFTGGVYFSGDTTTANLSNDNWMNYNKKYVTMSESDGAKKLYVAMQRCRFEAPVPHPDNGQSMEPRMGFYMRLPTFMELRTTARQNNDSLGYDLSNGTPSWAGVPFNWVAALDYDNDYPVYGVNWNLVKMAFNSNWNKKETFIANKPGQHTVSEQWYDWEGNLKCYDRRGLFVLAKSTSY